MECTPVSFKTAIGIHKYIRKTNSKNTIHLKNGSAGSPNVQSIQFVHRKKYLEEYRAHNRQREKAQEGKRGGIVQKSKLRSAKRANSSDKVKRKRERDKDKGGERASQSIYKITHCR